MLTLQRRRLPDILFFAPAFFGLLAITACRPLQLLVTSRAASVGADLPVPVQLSPAEQSRLIPLDAFSSCMSDGGVGTLVNCLTGKAVTPPALAQAMLSSCKPSTADPIFDTGLCLEKLGYHVIGYRPPFQADLDRCGTASGIQALSQCLATQGLRPDTLAASSLQTCVDSPTSGTLQSCLYSHGALVRPLVFAAHELRSCAAFTDGSFLQIYRCLIDSSMPMPAGATQELMASKFDVAAPEKLPATLRSQHIIANVLSELHVDQCRKLAGPQGLTACLELNGLVTADMSKAIQAGCGSGVNLGATVKCLMAQKLLPGTLSQAHLEVCAGAAGMAGAAACLDRDGVLPATVSQTALSDCAMLDGASKTVACLVKKGFLPNVASPANQDSCQLEWGVDKSAECLATNGLGTSTPAGGMGYLDLANSGGRYVRHNCAIHGPQRKVYCWGRNAEHQLGSATSGGTFSPLEVAGLTGVQALALTKSSTCAVLSTGKVACWGSFQHPGGQYDGAAPFEIAGVDQAMSVVGGEDDTCALLSTGKVKCWGNPGFLWSGEDQFSDVVKLVSGAYHHCGLSKDKTVRCIGHNGQGQLGVGGTAFGQSPALFPAASGTKDISTSAWLSCALSETNKMQCAGIDYTGLLAQPGSNFSMQWVESPVDIPGVSDVKELATGGHCQACIITTANKVKCWGDAAICQGTLGNSQTSTSSTPMEVENVSDVKMVRSYDSHTCALTNAGKLYCWGFNDQGQLGNGNAGVGVAMVPLPVVDVP